MKKTLTIIIFLLSSIYSIGQFNCDLTTMTKESKDSLDNFWTTLNEAVLEKDSSKLFSICDFPFYVSNDILTKNSMESSGGYKFSQSNIMPYAGLIFYDSHFISALSQCQDPAKYLILHGNFKSRHKICNYVFCYSFKNEKGIDEERCFSINRKANSFRLASHWTKR